MGSSAFTGTLREALVSARRSQAGFSGLIQHSFALRVPDELKPQYTGKDISDPRELLSALLTVPAGQRGGFRLMSVGDMGKDLKSRRHSLIVGSDFTDIVGQALPFAELGQDGRPYPWPHAFAWANSRREKSESDPAREKRRRTVEPDWDRVVPAEMDASGRVRPNDYLVVGDGSSSAPPCRGDPLAVSWLLCQLLAHRRSRLFGWSLERRIVNVLLPHALLRPARDSQPDPKFPCSDWILQPSLSLFLTNESSFRSIFSFTLFVIPVEADDDGACMCQGAPTDKRSHPQIVHQRQMSDVEIGQAVQAGWNIATSPRRRPEFVVSGPLCRYVAALDPTVPESLGVPQSHDDSAANGTTWGPLRLRKTVEAIALATVLRLVAGPGVHTDKDTAKKLGEKVLVALSSSRASSVVVVDDQFKRCETEKLRREGRFPGSLGKLMEKIGVEITVAPQKKYRLDRAFFDSDDYAIGVLPADRCVVVTADPCAQRGNLDSGLLEAGWIAYMMIGAATATGMMRSIYHEIEQVSGSSASAIADIEREVVVDLHEIYDLDITWPPYRERYRLLRDRFGITHDYESLQNKLEALSRESSTRFEDAAQKQLIVLTFMIVFLTLAVIAVTVLTK